MCFVDFNYVLSFDDQYKNPFNYERNGAHLIRKKDMGKNKNKIKIVYI
jgi:hypothetical protein